MGHEKPCKGYKQESSEMHNWLQTGCTLILVGARGQGAVAVIQKGEMMVF